MTFCVPHHVQKGLYDENGLVTVLSEIKAEIEENEIAKMIKNTFVLDEDERPNYRDDAETTKFRNGGSKREARDMFSVDVDEISLTSISTKVSGKIERVDVEMILRRRGGTSLLQLKSWQDDGAAESEERECMRVENMDRNGKPSSRNGRDAAMSGLKYLSDVAQVAFEAGTSAAEDLRSRVPLSSRSIARSLKSVLSSECVSKAMDQWAMSATRSMSDDFASQMEGSIHDSSSELCDAQSKLQKAEDGVDQKEETCAEGLEEREVSTNSSTEFSVTKKIGNCTGGTSNIKRVVVASVGIKPCGGATAASLRLKNRVPGPVDVDEVSLTTTMTEAMLQSCTKKHQQQPHARGSKASRVVLRKRTNKSFGMKG